MYKRRFLFVSRPVSRLLRTTEHELLISACVPPQPKSKMCSSYMCCSPQALPTYQLSLRSPGGSSVLLITPLGVL